MDFRGFPGTMVAGPTGGGHSARMPTPVLTPVDAARRGEVRLNPSQQRVFTELLAIGQQRPTCSPELVEVLRTRIEAGTKEALGRWTEGRFFLSKSTMLSALRCEGLPLAERSDTTERRMHQATAVGIVTHRAVQLANTHPGRTVSWYVEQSVEASLAEDGFSQFWTTSPVGVQSDVNVQALSRTTSFLDTFPPLDPAWAWRFEEQCQARIGALTLGAKPDLVLGRPRPDGRQTMFLCDMKTGSIHDDHPREAAFYALVATLRNGVAPFRSTVLSLASGEWTEPDVDEAVLLGAADDVVLAVNRIVDALTEARELTLTGGSHCRFCPARATCPSAED